MCLYRKLCSIRQILKDYFHGFMEMQGHHLTNSLHRSIIDREKSDALWHTRYGLCQECVQRMHKRSAGACVYLHLYRNYCLLAHINIFKFHTSLLQGQNAELKGIITRKPVL